MLNARSPLPPRAEDETGPGPHPPALLDALTAIVAATGGVGGALYRRQDTGNPEIVVGVGGGVPPSVDVPGELPVSGLAHPLGRVWPVDDDNDRSALAGSVLLVAGVDAPPDPDRWPPLLEAIERAWSIEERSDDDTSEPDWSRFPELIGRSDALRRVLRLVERIAPTQVSVLVLGESGTGKELVGRALHRLSGRTGAFMSESCAAISDSLLESELFGSEKGAFTGAHAARNGLIEDADGGTLFLDEIGEMGGSLQSKMLRVLQEREVRRVGSSRARPVDFRLVSATHRDLDHRVRDGAFRADLLFRIDVVRVELPPLRARDGDIPALARHFLEDFARAHRRPTPPLAPEAIQILERFTWPGNVRELRNEIERAFALSPERIGPESLSPRLRQAVLPHPLARRIRHEIGCDLPQLERVICGGVVREILRETNGNKAEAARRLGIPKTSLYRRMSRYGIRVEGSPRIESAPVGPDPRENQRRS